MEIIELMNIAFNVMIRDVQFKLPANVVDFFTKDNYILSKEDYIDLNWTIQSIHSDQTVTVVSDNHDVWGGINLSELETELEMSVI